MPALPATRRERHHDGGIPGHRPAVERNKLGGLPVVDISSALVDRLGGRRQMRVTGTPQARRSPAAACRPA